MSRSLNSSSAAGRVDQLALGLVQRDGLQRRAAATAASRSIVICRSAASTLSCGPIVTAPDAVAARDEVALDLHVLEHLGVRPAVRRQQRLEDLLALVRELAREDPARWAARWRRRACSPLPAAAPALGHRDEKERVVADLDRELGVNLVVGQMRVRVGPLAAATR